MEEFKQKTPIVKTYVIDLFAGAGGTSTGIFQSNTNIEVIACINHDKNAILSHAANYPNCKHYTEDIRTVDIGPLVYMVKELRRKDPTCKIAIWASLECTNFSNAKCGPKCADSRTLANDMFRYIDAINPDFFWVENVKEFLDWGPLKEDGYPDPNLKGVFFNIWKINMQKYFGAYYKDLLVSADFGGRTIRKRLFIQFSKEINEIGIPKQTHSQDGQLYEKWLPVKDILDLENAGASIFTRKKPYVAKTHKRIYKGLLKHGHEPGTNYGFKYYGQGGHVHIDQPMSTLTTKDRVSLIHITPLCVKENFGTSDARSLNRPIGALTTVPKNDLIFTKSISFVHNPQYGGTNRSIDLPAATLIARQDKAPIGLTTAERHSLKSELRTAEKGNNHIEFKKGKIIYTVFSTDDEWMVKIKEYMYENNLIDISVRPLSIPEMLRIQGFPDNYILIGSQTEQKKYIGNSVEVHVGIALFRAIDLAIQTNYKLCA